MQIIISDELAWYILGHLLINLEGRNYINSVSNSGIRPELGREWAEFRIVGD